MQTAGIIARFFGERLNLLPTLRECLRRGGIWEPAVANLQHPALGFLGAGRHPEWDAVLLHRAQA